MATDFLMFSHALATSFGAGDVSSLAVSAGPMKTIDQEQVEERMGGYVSSAPLS
jgi:enoyl-[acyl-carrier-protein] reductase (NADH)